MSLRENTRVPLDGEIQQVDGEIQPFQKFRSWVYVPVLMGNASICLCPPETDRFSETGDSTGEIDLLDNDEVLYVSHDYKSRTVYHPRVFTKDST